MKSRYCYCPMTAKRIGRRMTLADRFRIWQRNRQNSRMKPDQYSFGNYNAPVYPGK